MNLTRFPTINFRITIVSISSKALTIPTTKSTTGFDTSRTLSHDLTFHVTLHACMPVCAFIPFYCCSVYHLSSTGMLQITCLFFLITFHVCTFVHTPLSGIPVSRYLNQIWQQTSPVLFNA